jgi:hypothetical protein
MTRIWPVLAFLLVGQFACDVEPEPLPTKEAVALLDRETQPPLYQMLYDAPVLPASRPQQQKVRMLIWLLHMELTKDQLRRLEELRVLVEERRDKLADAENKVMETYENEENQIFEQLWIELLNGTAIDDPKMNEVVTQLAALKGGGERESALLTAKMEGLRSILEAERSFLFTLTPRQELLLTDSLFFLRTSLDPVGNPGNFLNLVGSTYDPGQYAVLTRGTGAAAIEPLNIGALWSENPELEENELHEARREVLLFLALMEPGLKEALAGAHKRVDANKGY